MKKKSGAAKVFTKAGSVWCHFSVQGDTLKLRRYSDGTTFELDVESDEIEDFVRLDDCKKLVQAKSYSYKQIEVWTQILQMLEAGTAIPRKGSSKRPAADPTIVPITELRRVYDVMKLLDVETLNSLADHYCEHPTSLERLWHLSRTTFSEYHNRDGWGKGKRKKLPQPPKSLCDVSTTNEFTAFVKRNGVGDESNGYTFVERELNPWRTRLGMFSNKLPATKSGRGGMDLLLQARANGLPVVGEVKVKDDKNAFYALIQVMTYAVESSTPRQIERLRNHFDEFGQLNPEEAAVEAAIFMVNPVPDRTLESVLKLIEVLNERQACSGLARIMLLINNGEDWTTHD